MSTWIFSEDIEAVREQLDALEMGEVADLSGGVTVRRALGPVIGNGFWVSRDGESIGYRAVGAIDEAVALVLETLDSFPEDDGDECPYGKCSESRACDDCKYDNDLQYREDDWR